MLPLLSPVPIECDRRQLETGMVNGLGRVCAQGFLRKQNAGFRFPFTYNDHFAEISKLKADFLLLREEIGVRHPPCSRKAFLLKEKPSCEALHK